MSTPSYRPSPPQHAHYSFPDDSFTNTHQAPVAAAFFAMASSTASSAPIWDGDRLAALVAANAAYLDLAWHVAIYAALVGSTAVYFTRKGAARARALRWGHLAIMGHIVLGLGLVWRYQYRAVVATALASTSSPSPLLLQPSALDMAAAALNGCLGIRLCKYESRGSIAVQRAVRAAFQTMGLQLLMYAACAYAAVRRGDGDAAAAWYHAMVKNHNGFAYARFVIVGSAALGLAGTGGYAAAAIGIPIGGMLGMFESKPPLGGLPGIPLAVVCMAALIRLEAWASDRITVKNARNPFYQLLVLCGFVEIQTFRELGILSKRGETSEEKESEDTGLAAAKEDFKVE